MGVMRGKINDRAYDIVFSSFDESPCSALPADNVFYNEVGMRDLFVPDTFRVSINGVVEQKNIHHVVPEALWHPLFVDNARRIVQRHQMTGCGDQFIQKLHDHIVETVGR